jgi:hypothetical protein
MKSQNENILVVLQRELDGVNAIRSIKEVLVEIQKLRGASNLYGILYSYSNKEEVDSYKNHIIKLIERIDKNFTILGDFTGVNPTLSEADVEIKELEENIVKFHQNIFDITIHHFDEYSKYARETINIMIDVADRSYLLADIDEKRSLLINILINIVLNLIETIGKLRSVGVKIINKKVKNIHDVSELQYYIEIVRNYINIFNLEFDKYSTMIEGEEREKFTSLKNRLAKDIDYFIKLTFEEVVKQDLIFIDPKYFFEQGDDIIRSESLFYNELFKLIENHLEKKIKKQKKVVFKERVLKYGTYLSILSFIGYSIWSLI